MIRMIFDLTLWAQLVRRKMWPQLFRFYGSVWLVTVLLVALSLRFVTIPESELPQEAPAILAALPMCLMLLCFNYVFSKLAGSPMGMLTSVALSATMLATYATGEKQFDGSLFIKAVAAFIVLLVFVNVIYRLSPLPYGVLGYEGWPHRRAMTTVLCVVGALGIVIVAGGLAHDSVTNNEALKAFLRLPSWSFAGATWLWTTIGWLLSNYDAELLPPLLTRVGIPCNRQLTGEDGHLVERLVDRLPQHPDL